MSGTVGLVAGDTARYTLFSVSLTQLKHPPNTRIDWATSSDIAASRNALVRRSLEAGSEWILFLDDDHVFSQDILMRLLTHEQDVVGSLYLRRGSPFSPVAFSHRNEDGLYQTIDLTTLPNEGLLKVQAVGAAGLLIRSEVFRAVPDPWFEHGRVGDWDASEDIIFCEKAQAAGFDVFIDLGTQLGHMTPSAVWPSWVDQEWAIGFSVTDGTRLYIPIEKAAEVEDAEADAVRR